jgi:hypothetical protein
MNRKHVIILWFLYLTVYGRVSSQTISAEKIIHLSFSSAKIGSWLHFLEENYAINFSFMPDQVPLEKEVTLPDHELTLNKLLIEIFKDCEIRFIINDHQVILYKTRKEIIKYTISGRITDSGNGENLAGANILISPLGIGTTSNNYGFYSISLPEGNYTVQFSYLGYEPEIKPISLTANTNHNAALKTEIVTMNEVTVESEQSVKQNVESAWMGVNHLNAKEIKSLPSIGGQPDVFKSMQFLPGIVPVNEGVVQYSVRGGSFDQNLILLDEAPVYNPSHVLGFFSVFNADAVQSVDMMKGYIPARYGGRLSSVADIHMREGNRNKFSVMGNIDPLSAGLTIESPLGNDKTSFLISGRYFNFKAMTLIAEGLREQKVIYLPLEGLNNFDTQNHINFYDLNLKINHKLNKNNQIYLSGYTGSDGFYFAQLDDRSRQNWGNTTATLRWNHTMNEKLFFNLSAIYSRYNYVFNLRDGANNYQWSAYMNQPNAKIDFDYYPNVHNHISFGASLGLLDIMPGKITPVDTSFVSEIKMANRKSLDIALYLNNEQSIGKFALNYGIRLAPYYSFYTAQSDLSKVKTNNNFLSIEPRLALRYLINDLCSFKISYTRTSQPLHLLSNATIGMPTDIWMPFNNMIKPQTADHVSAGFFCNFLKNRIESSMEIYYKQMHHVIDFKDNASIKLNLLIEDEILAGEGNAYGSEFLIRKTSGKLTGWISYTLSKTQRKIIGVNDNQYYPARYDQRHNITVFLSQQLRKRIFISSAFMYRTGQAVSMPYGTFDFKYETFTYYSSRNGFRLPDNHRLDLSITLKGKPRETKRWRDEWTISIYNVYNHHNIFSYYFKGTELHSIYLPGAIPMIRYSFNF